MDNILVLSEKELRRAVRLDLEAIDVIENVFRALAGEGVIMPPVLSMHMEDANGEVDVKTAYLPGLSSFAVKISPGFFDNPSLGLPSTSGLMVMLSARTGHVDAVLLDNGYLTNIRTAAAGAVAARHLAPATVDTAGVIGAGVQARLQIVAAHMARPFSTVLLWSPNDALNESAAEEIAARTGAGVTIASTAEAVVTASELVVTSTPASSPVLMADWLHPRLHITCMGADQSNKNELDPKVLERSDLYACDRVAQCELIGELRTARAAGYLNDVTPPELGQIITGKASGRESDRDITVCDLTGTGAQDTAIANYALQNARELGLGLTIVR